jgi:hypothetical protein
MGLFREARGLLAGMLIKNPVARSTNNTSKDLGKGE